MKTFKTLEEYYDFFEAIPEEKWCTHNFENYYGQRCVIGHLTDGVGDVFGCNNFETLTYHSPISINDGMGEFYKLGDTPKERVLSYIILRSALQEELDP